MRRVSETLRPADAYLETLQQVARRHGVSVKRDLLDAAQPPGCPVPIVDDRVPAPVARWVAAHELAHAKLRHSAVVPPRAKWARIGAYVFVILLLLLGVLGVLTTENIWLVAALGVIGTLALWLVANRAIAANLRAAEAAADALTAKWGYPVTDEVASQLSAREKGALRSLDFFRLAPRPADRVAIRNPKPRG